MYKHYESSEDVFVDREEHIEWMSNALERCKKKSVVLHLKGIGGIGKSSLLNHWINIHERTIRLDCEQYSDFYHRLNILAKGAALLGIKLQRFDILWQIRQRFIEGVEPVKEEGRLWAKEVIMAIPFIGSLASIGSAINAVGTKITPKLKGKYSTVGKWLQEQLGKNHIEKLLEILWKEPRRAEFLFLEALLEDINNRESINIPIIFLLDHFEYVDEMKTLWKYSGHKINETELWAIFLSNISNSVGVLASRRPAAASLDMEFEETELLELDRDSCFEMLELQDVSDKELQGRIVSVSGGNPFVIDAICDWIKTSDVSVSEIEDLRADTLADVRLQVWRRLFSQAEGLMDIINRAGLVSFFSREIMEIITPAFTSDLWNRMTNLSFVKDRGDGTYVLHDLADDLVKAELGSRLKDISNEVALLLMKGYEATEDYTLLGLSFSVEAHSSLMNVFEKIIYKWIDFSWNGMFREALIFLDAISIESPIARAVVNVGRGWHLSIQNRVSEGEEAIRSAIESLKTVEGITDSERNRLLAIFCSHLGMLMDFWGRLDEAEEMLVESLNLYHEVTESPPNSLAYGRELREKSMTLRSLGRLMISKGDSQEAMQFLESSLETIEKWAKIEKEMTQEHISREVSFVLGALAQVSLATNNLSKTEEISRRMLKAADTPVIRISSLYFLGNSLALRGQLNEAKKVIMEKVKEAKKLSDVSPDWQGYVGALDDLFFVLRLRGDYHQAAEIAQQITALHKEFVNKAPEIHLSYFADIHRFQGIVSRKMGKLKEAEIAYQTGITLAREYIKMTDSRNESILITILNDYGVLLHQKDDLQKAEERLRKAIEICRRSSDESVDLLVDNRELSACLCNLGAIMLNCDRDREAEELLRESLLLRRKIQKEAPEVFYYPSYIASSLNNLAVFYGKSGSCEDCEKCLIEALETRMKYRTEETSEVYDPGLVAVLSNIGKLRALLGDISGSRDTFSKAVASARELYQRNPETHRQALIQVLCNMHYVASDDDADNTLKEEISAELLQLGVRRIPMQLMWFVEISESLKTSETF
ncbi:MAG: tetratricopeptide repeat protein [Candidatus Thorarchaeota archaeon]